MSRHEHMLRERETRAWSEVGKTTIQPGTALGMSFVFLISIFAIPIVQHVAEWRDHAELRRSVSTPQVYDIFQRASEIPANYRRTSGRIWNKVRDANSAFLRDIQDYESQLEDQSFFGRLILPPTQLHLSGCLGLGNEQAYLGRGQWLFYRPDIDYLTGPGFLGNEALQRRSALSEGTLYPDPRPVIFQFQKQLAERGIELILMPTPIKSMVHPQMFNSSMPPELAFQNSSYSKLIEDLEAGGVWVFDTEAVVAAMRTEGHSEFYLATDTHWRPNVAERVARELKRLICAKIELPPTRDQNLKTETMAVTNLGDVAVMLRLPDDQQLYEPESVELRQILTESGEFWRPTKSADVLILGDSFSNIYSLPGLNWGESAGFVEQLSYELGRPVDAMLRNDNGSYATRQMLGDEMARGRDRLEGNRVVVWQFALRELASGNWKPVSMKLHDPVGSEMLTLSEGERVKVSGLISDMSSIPKRGSVPYRDHILAMHLVDLQMVDGTQAHGSEAVVYTFSMRDNQWTDATRFRPGQRVTMELLPWLGVEREMGRINRSELEEDRLMFAEPTWGEIIAVRKR